MRQLLLRSGLFIVDPTPWSHTHVRSGVTSPVTPPVRVGCHSDAVNVCCLYLHKTRLETQNLHTTVQLGVKVGCSCNQLTSILHVLVTCWHFFRLEMNTNVLNGAAFRACTFSVSNVCNKCTKQTPSCWLAGMWKIGVCSESLADLGGDC